MAFGSQVRKAYGLLKKPNRSRTARILATAAIRNAADWGEKRTKSRTVRLKLARFRNMAEKVSPSNRFFAGEVFIPLKQINSAEVMDAYYKIKKNWWHNKNVERNVMGVMGITFAGPIIGGLIGQYLFKRPMTGMAVGSIAAFAGAMKLAHLQWNSTSKLQESLKTVHHALNSVQDPRTRRLVDSKKFNFFMVDFENKGFRLCRFEPKVIELARRINDSKGGIIVLNKKGEIVYPKMGDNKNPLNVIPAPEQRIGATDRRQEVRRKGDEKTRGTDRRKPQSEYVILRF